MTETTTADDFGVKAIDYKKGGVDIESEEMLDREQAYEELGDSAWVALASQRYEGTDVSEKDGYELVAVTIPGWFGNDDEKTQRAVGTIYGMGTYLAVLDKGRSLGEKSDGSPRKAWAFSSIYNGDRERWVASFEYGALYLPKAVATVYRPEGEPSPADTEPLRSRDGRSEDWHDMDWEERMEEQESGASFERMVAAARERAAEREKTDGQLALDEAIERAEEAGEETHVRAVRAVIGFIGHVDVDVKDKLGSDGMERVEASALHAMLDAMEMTDEEVQDVLEGREDDEADADADEE